ncbi:MAG: DUF523 domain-containing protein [Pseudomonadota bacterium]
MILVSKCCAGIPCRYQNNGYLRGFLPKLGMEHDFIAVCPEQLGGLPTPREGCSVKGGRVLGRQTGFDFTPAYEEGARRTLDICRRNGITRAYLLKSSPSCGKAYGVTAKLLEDNGITVVPV